jgi:FixJ family two-component response regulator
LTGPELQQTLIAAGRCLPIVFVTGHGDIQTSVRTIKAGAEDFLTKPVAKDQLLDAIERAITRGEMLRIRAELIDIARSRVERLTPREREVFILMVRGLLNKQIAHELGTTVRTIKAHRKMVLQKCEVRSVAELVILAQRTDCGPDDDPVSGRDAPALGGSGHRDYALPLINSLIRSNQVKSGK